jgi:hypothetical protein
MYYDGAKPLDEYNVGDVITCRCDANPDAWYFWVNTRTFEYIYQQDFVIPQEWEGFSQVMRCTATNTILNVNYTMDLSVTVNVVAVTSPTTPPTTTPTTTPPLVSDCLLPTGSWSSSFPTIGALCVTVDTSNAGYMTGGFKNGTDTYFLDIVGNVELGHNEHASWSAIWPQNIAVSSFIAECFRCQGVEILIVNAISRTKGTAVCGLPGEIFYSVEYAFYRDSTLKCAQFIPPIATTTLVPGQD